MLRLFAALPIPDDVAGALGALQRGLDGARWSPRDNLHLTLRFIGDMSPHAVHDLDAALGEIRAAPFEIALSGIGVFGGDKPHAMWVGVRPNAHLLALQKQCEQTCRRVGLAADPRNYTPHVTICYLPRHQSIEPVMAFQGRHNLFSTPPWTADRFYLYASHTQGSGPSRYSHEAEYPFVI